MNKNFDILAKTDEAKTASPSKQLEFQYRKRKIAGILASLRKPANVYSPQKTIDSICDYISTGDHILYSELTSIIYTLSSSERTNVEANIENLRVYAMDDANKVSQPATDAVIRIWDHFNLACNQVDNARKIHESSITTAKDEVYSQLYEKFKGMEKEYIAILGIFASIVLSFTAGLAFTSSVFENIHKSSIYRTVTMALVVGLVLVNIIHVLFRYTHKLVYNQPKFLSKSIIAINVILLLLIVAVTVAWHFGWVEDRNKRISSRADEIAIVQITTAPTPQAVAAEDLTMVTTE